MFGSVGYTALSHSYAQIGGWGRVIIQDTNTAVASGVVNVAILEASFVTGDIKGTSFALPYYDQYYYQSSQFKNDYTYRLRFVSAQNLGGQPYEFSHWRLFTGGGGSERIIKTPELTVKRSELHSTNIFLITKKPSPKPTSPPQAPKPAPKPAPSPAPKPVTPPSTLPRPAAPKQQVKVDDSLPQGESKDTTKPGTPQQLSASIDESTGHVLLSWAEASDNVGVSHYIVERSTDQKNWQVLSDEYYNLSYVDSDTAYEAKYFYRVKAVDFEDNSSDYVTTDVVTMPFQANVTVENGGVFGAGDWLTVTVPAHAVYEDVQCSVVDHTELAALGKGEEVFAGPYRIVCKRADRQELAAFESAVQVAITLTEEVQNKYSNKVFYAQRDGDWSRVNRSTSGDTISFTLENTMVFAGAGKLKSSSLFIKILLVITGIGSAGAAVIGVLYWRYRRDQTKQYQYYLQQQYGL